MQRAGADAGRVQLLQQPEHALYFGGTGIQVVIDGQLVAQLGEVLAQQSVVVERADEVFHDVVLALGQVHQSHLLLQLVVERDGLAVDHFLALVGHAAAVVDGQVLVVAAQSGQCIVESRLPVLAFALGVVVVGRVSFRRVLIVGILRLFRVVGASHLQGGIVVHLGVDAFGQSRDGQLNELRV